MHIILDPLERLFVWLSQRRHLEPEEAKVQGLGVDLEIGDAVTLSTSDLARHLYILGSTGCGKTTLILKLIEQDIKREHAVVVLDLRGDLVAGALGVCARLGVDPSRLTLLDLRDRHQSVSFNPLAGPGEPYIRALHVLDVIAAESGSWGVQLEETLRSTLLLLAHAEESVTQLEGVFFDRGFRSACLRRVTDPELLHFWQRFDAMNAERQQTLALPVLNKVTPLLAVPRLRHALASEGALNLTDVLSEKGRIFLVSLAVDELHRSSRMVGSLLISSIAREMMSRVDVSESKRNPVRLYVDEFENMASEAFEGIIAEGRRFGLALVLSHQTLSQLSAKLRSVIRNNVGIQILFQCGFEDAQSVARELPEHVSLEDVRSLRVGHAFLMKRNGTASLVHFHKPAPHITKRAVESFRRSLALPIVDPQPLTGPTPDQHSEESPLEDWL